MLVRVIVAVTVVSVFSWAGECRITALTLTGLLAERTESTEVRDVSAPLQQSGANDEPADFSVVVASAFVSGTPVAPTVTVTWMVNRQGAAITPTPGRPPPASSGPPIPGSISVPVSAPLVPTSPSPRPYGPASIPTALPPSGG